MEKHEQENPSPPNSDENETGDNLERALDSFVANSIRCKRYPTTEYDSGYKKPENVLGIITVILTGIAVFTTIVGAWFAYGAYNAAKSQANADWISARAAQIAAVQAKRQADAATQPYIFVSENDENSIYSWIYEGSPFINVKITAKNYGSAPAIINQITCIFVWGTKQSPPEKSVDISANGHSLNDIDNNAQFPFVVAPGGIISGKCESPGPINDSPPPSEAQTQQYRINRAMFNGTVWVVGIVNYTDVNGSTHRTTFCAQNDDSWGIVQGGDAQCQERD